MLSTSNYSNNRVNWIGLKSENNKYCTIIFSIHYRSWSLRGKLFVLIGLLWRGARNIKHMSICVCVSLYQCLCYFRSGTYAHTAYTNVSGTINNWNFISFFFDGTDKNDETDKYWFQRLYCFYISQPPFKNFLQLFLFLLFAFCFLFFFTTMQMFEELWTIASSGGPLYENEIFLWLYNWSKLMVAFAFPAFLPFCPFTFLFICPFSSFFLYLFLCFFFQKHRNEIGWIRTGTCEKNYNIN